MLFVFASSFALAQEVNQIPSPTRDPNAVEYDYDHPERLMPEQLVAHAFVLMEMGTGDVLMQKNADQPMYPASTTKIMTALLALKKAESQVDSTTTFTQALAQRIKVSETAVDIPSDASKAGFRAGDDISLSDALYGMMLPSGNDAANVIAEYVSGSQESFVNFMNQTAAVYGLKNTHFTNAHGYHDPEHYSSAFDLATITRAAMQESAFRRVVSTLTYTIVPSNRQTQLNLQNTNNLINPESGSQYLKDAVGVKTGSQSQSAYCLVAAAERNGVTLIAVILYSGYYSQWPDAKWLFEYGFTQYSSMSPQEIYEADPITIQTTRFSTTDEQRGELVLRLEPIEGESDVRISGPNATVERLKDSYRSYTTIEWTRGKQPRAPITVGEVLGVMTFYTPNGEAPKYNLVAPRSVSARLDAPLSLEEIETLASSSGFTMPAFSLELFLPPILILLLLFVLLRTGIRSLLNARRDEKQIPKKRMRSFR